MVLSGSAWGLDHNTTLCSDLELVKPGYHTLLHESAALWVPLLQQFSARRDFTTGGYLTMLGGVLTVTTKEGRACCWYLLVRAQGCCLTHYKAQGGLPRQSPTPQCPQCCAEKPCFSRGHKANFKRWLLISLARQGAPCA